jgi:hypothetical protein
VTPEESNILSEVHSELSEHGRRIVRLEEKTRQQSVELTGMHQDIRSIARMQRTVSWSSITTLLTLFGAIAVALWEVWAHAS